MKRILLAIIIIFSCLLIADVANVNGVSIQKYPLTVTETLYVSPDGSDGSGKTWEQAFTTIQSALDAASTDANDCTLIMIAPHATYYDINTTGDPTWTGNYILSGTHRSWASVKNTHASQTSIMKFSGKVQVINLAFSLTAGGNGLIFTGKGVRIDKCGFNSENSTGACTAIWLDGDATIKGARIRDIEIFGNQSYTTGILIDNAAKNYFANIHIHDALTGIQIVNASSEMNYFEDIGFGVCTLGLDIDAGTGQHFTDINFHANTLNVDDEIDGHVWRNTTGQFDMNIEPDDLTGITLTASADAGVWGDNTEIRAAATSTKPFRIIGYSFEPAVTQKHKIRFTADDGVTYFDEIFVEQTKNSTGDAGSGTEYIFNEGTQIKASVKAESGGSDTVKIWIKLQEI